MEERKDVYYFDMVPYFAELVSRKERLYKTIDSIYKGDEIEYNRYGKESKYYNNPLGTRGSIKQKKYYNRVLAITSNPNNGKENMCTLINELKKEFSYVYDAIAVRKIKKLSEYVLAFDRKYGERSISLNDGNDNMLMFCIFSIYLENKYDETDEHFQYFIRIGYERMKLSNKKSCVKIDKEDLKILNNRYKEMDKKLDFTISASMKIYNIHDEEKINKDWIIRYVVGLDAVLDQQQLNLENVVDKLLTKKEIMELMYICYCTNEEDFYDDEKLSLWLIAAGEIAYLAKAYNEAKKFIEENDNEDLLNGLRIEKDKYNDIKNKLTAQETKADNFKEENKKLYKENERLKLELEELKNIKKEVVSLRDYIFSEENRDEFKDNEVSQNEMINYLNKVDGIIVGGHPTWNNKIMQTINWEHIHVEALNFDTKILKDKLVVVNTSYMSHGIYYKLISKISEIKELKFINNVTNVDRSLSEIYRLAQ